MIQKLNFRCPDLASGLFFYYRNIISQSDEAASRFFRRTTENKVSLSDNILYFCYVERIQKRRTIVFYKNYFEDFFVKQRDKVKEKIIWTFSLIEEIDKVPETYLKHLENTNGLYEIRVQQGSDIFRIFCFFDHGRIVVLANGFQKKTGKTPKKELEKAEKIKIEYESEKK